VNNFSLTAQLIKWEDMRLDWSLPGAKTPGTARAVYDLISASSINAHHVVIFHGQSTPVHTTESDHLMVQIEGIVEFDLVGDQKYVLHPKDLFVFPAGVPYRYTNVGPGDALFVSVACRADTWPPGPNVYEM